MSDDEEKPVLNGLLALVAVAVVVGLLAGIGVLTASRVTGLGSGGDGGGEAGDELSLYMPSPEKTTGDSDPLVTLIPSETPDKKGEEKSEKAEKKKRKKKAKKPPINLSQGSSEVAAGEQLYLSGVYRGGEGAVLDIEYKVNDEPWEEFPLDVNVSNETFSTYVETSRTGTIKWRVTDKDKKKTSNVVTVQFG